MKKITTIFTTALISAGLLAASAVQADDGMKHQWRYASVAPPGTPWVNHGQAFRDALFENTGGAIDITMYNGGQLGTEVDTLRELSEGTIDIGAFSTPVFHHLCRKWLWLLHRIYLILMQKSTVLTITI